MGTLFWIAVVAALVLLVWRGRRRRDAWASAVAAGLALIAATISLLRVYRATWTEPPRIPRDIHYAIGVRLGELARERLAPNSRQVLIIRPMADHPAHRRVIDAQEAGVRHGLQGSGMRFIVEAVDLKTGVSIPLSVPRLEPSQLRTWTARHGPLAAMVSLAGAPKISAHDGPSDIPPLIALSFTDPRDLRWAFQMGWLAACIYQTSSGQDLDVARLSVRELVERTCQVVTLEEARAGRIPWRP